MTRKKVKRVKIANESKRNSVLRNRTEGLLRKASELSILFDSYIGIVIPKPGQNNITLWPSPNDFRARLSKIFDFPEMERERKFVKHDKHLIKIVEEETQKLRNIGGRSDLREYGNLMNGLIEGKSIYELDLNQMNVLCSIAEEKVKELQKRKEEFNEQDVPILSLAPPVPSVEVIESKVPVKIADTAASTLIENLRTDPWFIETMFDGQINRNFSRE